MCNKTNQITKLIITIYYSQCNINAEIQSNTMVFITMDHLILLPKKNRRQITPVFAKRVENPRFHCTSTPWKIFIEKLPIFLVKKEIQLQEKKPQFRFDFRGRDVYRDKIRYRYKFGILNRHEYLYRSKL